MNYILEMNSLLDQLAFDTNVSKVEIPHNAVEISRMSHTEPTGKVRGFYSSASLYEGYYISVNIDGKDYVYKHDGHLFVHIWNMFRDLAEKFHLIDQDNGQVQEKFSSYGEAMDRLEEYNRACYEHDGSSTQYTVIEAC